MFLWSCSNDNHQEPIRDYQIYTEFEHQLKTNSFFLSPDTLRLKAEIFQNDSLKNLFFFKISNSYYQQDDSLNFRYWNKRNLNQSIRNRDTIQLGKSYWLLGNFYDNQGLSDSAYYCYQKAFIHFNAVRQDLRAGKVLLNMAIIQKNIKDYSGSEVTTIRAIKKVKPLNAQKQLYAAYNNLGIIYNELDDHLLSYKYHQKALKFANELSDTALLLTSMNNIGVLLKKTGDYARAGDVFRESLGINGIEEEDPELYSMLIDNLAHAENLKTDFAYGDSLFLEALEMRTRIGHEAGITISRIHLSEYYLNRKDTAKALCYATEALNLAEENSNSRDILASLLLLAKSDPANSKSYLHNYIRTNNELQKQERLVRNKFARIQFETDEFIAENEELTEQRKWILGGSLTSVSMILLIVVIWRQKVKNKKLELEKEQQQANEHIYNLLLEQEYKMEEGRRIEKERISRELHDGVLGTMYGVRFNLSNLNSKNDPTSVESKEKLLGRLQSVEEEIRTISRDLQKESLFGKAGFTRVLQYLVKEREKELGFLPHIEFHPDLDWVVINNRCKMNLYRIIQEALHNIQKYAEASKTVIRFGKDDHNLLVEISDNGKGMDYNKKTSGIGLKNIYSRVEDLHGKTKITSDSSGTEINISLPLKVCL